MCGRSQCYDALVWKTSGGKTKYLLNDADALTHDDVGSVGEAIKVLLTRTSPVTLENIKARQQELEARFEVFGGTTDAEAIWKHYGLDDIPAASLASGPEFVAMVKARKK